TVAVQPYGNLSIRNAGTKALAGNLTIAGNLDFSSAKLNLANYSLSVATITNASEFAYVVPGASGKLAIRNIGTGTGGQTGAVLFPIGSSTSYTPAYITNIGAANTFSLYVADGLY